ncbi:hypothetical protein AX15_001049 [Amanita polypyramis BW_CC]|nr:hypothetical protein AX15_001049 [Amanita polypyramis BW_CC]
MTGFLHSFGNFPELHVAALKGNDEKVLRAVGAGADINALDSVGRTAIMCAVAGENWREIDALDNASFVTKERLNVIRRMLSHPDISLYTMNAPQNSLNGVTPLGMAAWLDAPDVVKMLLEESADAVAVDGMDIHGATALMYAARDGRLEVVRILLSHGARPDFRDCNHRTSIQYALFHPQILWLCELILRNHRWQECQLKDRIRLFQHSESHLLDLLRTSIARPFSYRTQPGPNTDFQLLYPLLAPSPPLDYFDPIALTRAAQSIISCIESEDLPFLYSILFAPPLPHDAPVTKYPLSVPLLINRPDEKTGWSPIHYCAAATRPNVHILDALYCAGADVSLFTKEEEATALHILAMLVCLPEKVDTQAYELRLAELYDFTVHLISDLRAPLAARDKDDETCIHVAAEHGSCIELLMIFLECDATGAIREMRNARGLTALEVAKPEFREAFGQDAEKLRCSSSLSTRTIRPAESFASLASFKSHCLYSSSDTTFSRPVSMLTEYNEEFAVTVTGNELNDGAEVDLDVLVLAILDNLNNTSSCLQPPLTFTSRHRDSMLRTIEATSTLSRRVIGVFRTRVDDVSRALQELTADTDKIKGFWEAVDKLAEDKARGLAVKRVLRRQRVLGSDGSLEQHWVFEGSRERGSEDSQTTAVSHFLTVPGATRESQTSSTHKRERKISALHSPSLLSLITQKLDITTPGSSRPPSPILPSTPSVSCLPWQELLGSPLSTTPDQSVYEGTKRDAISDTHVSVGTQTSPFDFILGMLKADNNLLSSENPNTSPAAVAAAVAQIISSWPEWHDDHLLKVDSVTYYKAHLANLVKIERALPQKAKDGVDPKIRQMIKGKRRLLQEKVREMEQRAVNQNTRGGKESKVKAWIKKMTGLSGESVHKGHGARGEEYTMSTGPTAQVMIVYDIDGDNSNVAREVKRRVDEGVRSELSVVQDDKDDNEAYETKDPSIETALRTSKIILSATGRDLCAVDQCLINVSSKIHSVT